MVDYTQAFLDKVKQSEQQDLVCLIEELVQLNLISEQVIANVIDNMPLQHFD